MTRSQVRRRRLPRWLLIGAGALALALGLGTIGWAVLRGGETELACTTDTLSVSASPSWQKPSATP